MLHSHLLPPLPASTLGALFGSQVEDEDITLPPQWHQARTRLLVAATTRFMAAKAVLEGPDHGAWSDQMSDIPDEPDDSEG